MAKRRRCERVAGGGCGRRLGAGQARVQVGGVEGVAGPGGVHDLDVGDGCHPLAATGPCDARPVGAQLHRDLGHARHPIQAGVEIAIAEERALVVERGQGEIAAAQRIGDAAAGGVGVAPSARAVVGVERDARAVAPQTVEQREQPLVRARRQQRERHRRQEEPVRATEAGTEHRGVVVGQQLPGGRLAAVVAERPLAVLVELDQIQARGAARQAIDERGVDALGAPLAEHGVAVSLVAQPRDELHDDLRPAREPRQRDRGVAHVARVGELQRPLARGTELDHALADAGDPGHRARAAARVSRRAAATSGSGRSSLPMPTA
jgi:hypothetical protein